MSFEAFTPRDVLAPVRLANGSTQLGRQTSTTEQRTEAIQWIVDRLTESHTTEGRAEIIWSRGVPTVLEVRIRLETVSAVDEDDEPIRIGVAVVDRVLEMTLDGAEIHTSRAQRAEQLQEEVSEMARSGSLY